ncbi:MAG: class I SAM-dependent DNA methyltransferase [bacterium]|nr:class I SAM-dependent DNA methyltransferase [bacterium]
MNNFASKAGIIWQIAELLRGGWKQYEYQDVILPLVVLKRLDAVLTPTKKEVLAQHHRYQGKINLDPILKKAAKAQFYNTSPYDFAKLLEDPKNVAKNFRHYIAGFSENIQDIVTKFDFEKQLDRLEGGDLLYLIIKELNKVDLHPSMVDNHEMGSIFEELIRKFAEQSNETAGEHYTPREVIELMVEVLFDPDRETLKRKHIIKTIYDCACGTGGMLTVGKDFIRGKVNPAADVYVYGQELNPATYAICKSDMLIRGEGPDKIKGGEKDHSKASTLANDQFFGEQFDYMLTNPPFGVDWKKDKDVVEREAERGHAGRFGAGLPRISDGQFLFLQHLIAKMRNPSDGGSRLAIVFNGSPLFTGDAGSGESEIRRWILEHDWLEAIIALPDQLFYNTGISTYLWFLSNRKSSQRKGKVQLIDARQLFGKMRKSLGNKRNQITDANRAKILEIYRTFVEGEHCRIFATTDFAYRQIVVERPLRRNFQTTPERLERLKAHKLFDRQQKGDDDSDAVVDALVQMDSKVFMNRESFLEAVKKHLTSKDRKLTASLLKAIWQELGERDETADVCTDSEGNPEPDTDLRDSENIPWGQDIQAYFEREVRPYVPDAWIDQSYRDHKDNKLGRVGYEIPLTRYFYTYQPPRDLAAIEGELAAVEGELAELLKKL